ncbi:MAG TPA: hypothetical protein VGG39_29465 [Polyangiaceae bacterium]|jgi:hypothetical protein
MNLRLAFAVPVAVLFALEVLGACKDTPPPPTCTDLAPPACPEDNGADVCQDPTCASVYSCQDGSWVFLHDCSSYDPEAGVHPAEAGEAGPEFDANVDAPPGAYGGPGCVDLENPDCPLGTGIACVNSPGCCDCEDLYVCDDGAWDLWGECSDAGLVRAGP